MSAIARIAHWPALVLLGLCILDWSNNPQNQAILVYDAFTSSCKLNVNKTGAGEVYPAPALPTPAGGIEFRVLELLVEHHIYLSSIYATNYLFSFEYRHFGCLVRKRSNMIN